MCENISSSEQIIRDIAKDLSTNSSFIDFIIQFFEKGSSIEFIQHFLNSEQTLCHYTFDFYYDKNRLRTEYWISTISLISDYWCDICNDSCNYTDKYIASINIGKLIRLINKTNKNLITNKLELYQQILNNPNDYSVGYIFMETIVDKIEILYDLITDQDSDIVQTKNTTFLDSKLVVGENYIYFEIKLV